METKVDIQVERTWNPAAASLWENPMLDGRSVSLLWTIRLRKRESFRNGF
jgi:hypothetical protein